MQEKFHMNKETGEVEALALICSVQVNLISSKDLKLSKQFIELPGLHHEQSKDLFQGVSRFSHCFFHNNFLLFTCMIIFEPQLMNLCLTKCLILYSVTEVTIILEKSDIILYFLLSLQAFPQAETVWRRSDAQLPGPRLEEIREEGRHVVTITRPTQVTLRQGMLSSSGPGRFNALDNFVPGGQTEIVTHL